MPAVPGFPTFPNDHTFHDRKTDYYQPMETKYPTLHRLIRKQTLVHSFSVDELTKSMKVVEDKIRKLELEAAKETKGYNSNGQQLRQLDVVQKLLARISLQLDRVLGV